MSILSSARTVLILGDEGLQIYAIGRLGARFIDSVPWVTDGFSEYVRELLVHKCKKKPIVILNDMVEQHYRKERVPQVGVFDRANVLKRRLNMAFPSYRVRAALKLDEKKSYLPKGSSKGAAYLFAGVPVSDAFNKTMSAVGASGVSIIGFYLLPLEGAAMVKALSTKISKARKSNAVWSIFMGQHHNGAVRQIVTRDGELALTRMTPIVDTDVEPDLWAKEISNELNATMSYLSRFGYKETDGLNVIVIANENIEPHLKSAIHVDCNLEVMTSIEAGKLLGVNVGVQSDLRYADPLHAVYLGRQNKFKLPMQSRAVDSITKPRRIATLLSVLLLAGCAYVGYIAFASWSDTIKIKEDIRIVEERKKSIKQEYDLEVEKKKEIGFDFVLVSNSVEIFNDLDRENIKPLTVLKEIGQSMGAGLRLDKLDVQSVLHEDKNANNAKNTRYLSAEEKEKLKKTITETVMTISFDSGIDPTLGVQKVNEFTQRVQGRLPKYDVTIVKQVADLSYTGNFVGESGAASLDENGEPEEYTAEILLRGPVR